MAIPKLKLDQFNLALAHARWRGDFNPNQALEELNARLAQQATEDVIDPKFFDKVAQIAHFSATCSISLILYRLFGWKGWAVGAAGILLYALWHEFIRDPVKENLATRGSDLKDFLYLCAGPVAARLVILLPHMR
jgi:hypothetical protein